MQHLNQSPKDPAFVQDPYAFYDKARACGPFFHWQDYGMAATTSHAAVNAILRDRRFGRAVPPDQARPSPAHLAPFDAVERHSLLELEPPTHTRLRGLVLRAFTQRRIAGLAPEIAQLTHDLVDALPPGEFDLLKTFGQRLPVIIIARLLGVPETMADDLLRWSKAMVAMYVAGRSLETEHRAAAAAADFAAFLRAYVEDRRTRPADDLITHLIAAESEGERLTTDELISTCILLLNAGHEATVHSIGNGVKALLESGCAASALAPEAAPATVEEILRFDPPLHLFTRYAYDDIEVMGQTIPKGAQVALLLAAANRDPAAYDSPATFLPTRSQTPNVSLGAGLHFCVGAPLARLELTVALPILFARMPGLRIAAAPVYADTYHFHGLQRLMVARG
ncbi:cytochrome P450 [Fertoebacter nigrum]|uniref:Cytochrome P450 n=1 Tax=Fertoeibacter niger TaxID=2656921 RepID=A0A8X8KLJ5_9RHOB|nr:cytochrome P450 [Fertoeibacter niger]NUB42905.1 cytochrome P450 [Fertoeibacter niger]